MRTGILIGINKDGEETVLAMPSVSLQKQLDMRRAILTSRGKNGKGKNAQEFEKLMHYTSDGLRATAIREQVAVTIEKAKPVVIEDPKETEPKEDPKEE